MKQRTPNVIHAQEAYSKQELLQRLGISQKTWDQLLEDGLPYVQVGKARWVVGQDVLDFLSRRAVTKDSDGDS